MLTGAFRPPGAAATHLATARDHERAGRLAVAAEEYQAAIDAADERLDASVLAEALRRLGAVHRRRHDVGKAIELCEASREVALGAGQPVLAAEALNGIALALLWRGDIAGARERLIAALRVGAENDDLRGRIEQNLGITANIQGDFRSALSHYERSLEAFREARNDNGCATAYHNLGMISADWQRWDDAERYFRASLEMADAMGDVHLRALALLNRTEVYIARQHYEEARRGAEEALQIFDRLGARAEKSAAYKFLGMIYRETGALTLAESRLRAAIELASEIGAPAFEAEAARELAILHQLQGRSQEALRLLNASHRLFGRLDARHELIDVSSKRAQLERVYLDIVRDWGRSIESTDSYTHGHSERVARYGAALARTVGLDEDDITTIRVGAYLHDLGKVKVPHEILTKPGRLTAEEFDVIKQHPIFGLELLASVEFPWDIKPIIRSHHEKVDGSGYPDRLRGDEIPLTAQLICVVDVFDALTTTRSYRPAMPHAVAVAEMQKSRHWWRPELFEGFMSGIATGDGLAAA
ncbi:MAG TPA: HD domain-containing phosphohydrolase [Gemmatimonadaceae bacterium]|nr:HD domain-containing phosphohydrolase [Gemmatimonadaceae bacterium]